MKFIRGIPRDLYARGNDSTPAPIALFPKLKTEPQHLVVRGWYLSPYTSLGIYLYYILTPKATFVS